jgi:glycosyltransferase involved in cell wall biosynthesis
VTTPRVSVVLPVYRLVDTIAGNIDRVVAALAGVPDVEIVVADDGSDDGTRAAAEAAATRHRNVTVVGYEQNAGKGRAIRTGVAATAGETVVLLDGDLDLPPEQVPDVLDRFAASGADAMVGSKWASMKAGGYPLVRRILSRAFSLATRLLFWLPVSETQTGLKVFRREPLVRWLDELQVARYAYDLELLVLMRRAGCRIVETPVTLAVSSSSSSVTVKTLWEMGLDTLRVRLRPRKRK